MALRLPFGHRSFGTDSDILSGGRNAFGALGRGTMIVLGGDGINDTPALACAGVAAAIGAWTDATLESTDVVLTS